MILSARWCVVLRVFVCWYLCFVCRCSCASGSVQVLLSVLSLRVCVCGCSRVCVSARAFVCRGWRVGGGLRVLVCLCALVCDLTFVC